MGREPSNHNIHYQRIVLRHVPPGARRALDVGCGDGFVLRDLGSDVPTVVGLDPDPASVEHSHATAPEAEVVLGDVMSYVAEPFDLVASIATLHHVDTADGLRAMTRLLAPGGRLVVIGCARTELPQNRPSRTAKPGQSPAASSPARGTAASRCGATRWPGRSRPPPDLSAPQPVGGGCDRRTSPEGTDVENG